MDKKRGFAAHPELARKWGKINGRKYKRGKAKKVIDLRPKPQYVKSVNEEQIADRP